MSQINEKKIREQLLNSSKLKFINSSRIEKVLQSVNIMKRVTTREKNKQNESLMNMLSKRGISKLNTEREIIKKQPSVRTRIDSETTFKQTSYKNSNLVSPHKKDKPILIADSMLDTNDNTINNTHVKSNSNFDGSSETSKFRFSNLAQKIKLKRNDPAIKFIGSLNNSVELFKHDPELQREKTSTSKNVSYCLTSPKAHNNSIIFPSNRFSANNSSDKVTRRSTCRNVSKSKDNISVCGDYEKFVNITKTEIDNQQIENIEDLHFNSVYFYHKNRRAALELERKVSVKFSYDFEKAKLKCKKEEDRFLSVKLLDKEADL